MSCPCGLTREELDLYKLVENQKCKALYDKDGQHVECGKLYTSHPSSAAVGAPPKKLVTVNYLILNEFQKFTCPVKPGDVLKDIIINRIKEFKYSEPRCGFASFRCSTAANADVYSYDDVNEGEVLDFFSPASITAQSANEWGNPKVQQLRVIVKSVAMAEYFDRYGRREEFDQALGPKAQALLTALEHLSPETVTPPSKVHLKSWYDDAYRFNPQSAAQHPVAKALFTVFKWKTRESCVDGFVSRLLSHVGFDDNWLLVCQQHRLDLNFGSVNKHSIADFMVMDLLSFYRVAVYEDKSEQSNVDSFPQLLAEIISVHQANSQIREEHVAKARKLKDGSSSSKGIELMETDEKEEQIVGVRVNGSRFWFYVASIGSAIDNAMASQTTACDSTTVYKLGGEDGFDFCFAEHREAIIKVLDTICRSLISIGPSRGRLSSV